jgi:LacI family transcriptional regulator
VSRRRRGSTVPGIREIADSVGVSIGTVDRALHNRPGISLLTRERVLRMAKALAYRPNLAARYLSSRKELRIAVVLPRKIASFWSLVREGVQEAARPLEKMGLTVLHRSYPRLGEGELEAMEACLKEGIHGLVFAPGEPEKLKPLIAQSQARGIPTVCVNTDAPGTARIAAVTVDPGVSGSLVAELLGRFLNGRGSVLVVTGSFATLDHASKLDGFKKSMRELWPHMELAGVVEAHDDEVEAYTKSRDVLAKNANVSGVYVSTANSLPVLRAIGDLGLIGKVTVMTTDLFPALLPHIRSRSVAATIHQRPWTALQTLYRFLAEGQAPPPIIGLSPHIIMRSNVGLFLERIQSGTAENEGSTTDHE